VSIVARAGVVGIGLIVRVLWLLRVLRVRGWESSLVCRTVCLWWVGGGRISVLVAHRPRMYGRVSRMSSHIRLRIHVHILCRTR
jgi:hypothetical protein